MRARGVAALVLIGVLAGGCAPAGPRNSAGQVTRAATTDAFAVKVGDCTGPITNGSVDKLSLVPCDQEHAWEAYARTELAGEGYPGASSVQDKAESFCAAEFATFLGIAPGKSKYRATYLQPTRQTWEQAGDREILCLAGLASGGIKGSLRAVRK